MAFFPPCSSFFLFWFGGCVRSDLTVMWINSRSFPLCYISQGLGEALYICHCICRSLCPSCQLNYSYTKATAHICGGSSFLVLWACSTVTLQGPKLPLPKQPIPNSSLSTSAMCRLPPSPPCSIFQLHVSFSFSFSFHFMCPSPSLRLYEDRCSLPLTHRFPFLSHILCFSFSCLPASVHQTKACCHTQFGTLFSPQSHASPHTSCMSVSLVLPKQTPFTLIRFWPAI